MARKIEKSEWRPYLDRLSKTLVGKRAEIEVASLDIGDQIAAAWVPVLGVVYDPKSDVVEVACENLDHLIQKPRDLYVSEDAGRVTNLDVVDASGAHQIITFKEPLFLPAAAS